MNPSSLKIKFGVVKHPSFPPNPRKKVGSGRTETPNTFRALNARRVTVPSAGGASQWTASLGCSKSALKKTTQLEDSEAVHVLKSLDKNTRSGSGKGHQRVAGIRTWVGTGRVDLLSFAVWTCQVVPHPLNLTHASEGST